jgi:hypothetical protein
MAQTGLADYYVRQSYGDTIPDHATGPRNTVSGGVKGAGDSYPDTFLGRLNRRVGRNRVRRYKIPGRLLYAPSLPKNNRNMSQVGKFFDLEGRNTTFTDELRAGLVAFLTVGPSRAPPVHSSQPWQHARTLLPLL